MIYRVCVCERVSAFRRFPLARFHEKKRRYYIIHFQHTGSINQFESRLCTSPVRLLVPFTIRMQTHTTRTMDIGQHREISLKTNTVFFFLQIFTVGHAHASPDGNQGWLAFANDAFQSMRSLPIWDEDDNDQESLLFTCKFEFFPFFAIVHYVRPRNTMLRICADCYVSLFVYVESSIIFFSTFLDIDTKTFRFTLFTCRPT